MGSLETGLSLKRDPHMLRSSSATASRSERQGFGQRPRSRFARLLLFKKIHYLQWICAISVFFFFVIVFQMSLPGSMVENSGNVLEERERVYRDFSQVREIGELGFGEDMRFEPKKLLDKFQKEGNNNGSFGSREKVRFGYRKPQIAMVFADLQVDPEQILMVTVAVALQEIGYKIEVYTLEDGPSNVAWRNSGVPVNVIKTSGNPEIIVDWLTYDGILVNSIETKDILSRLVQDPFKSVPLIWTIHERTLASRLGSYTSSGQVELLNDWKRIFSRASVVVFPNYILPMLYSACDTGNYFVIPGSPVEAWEADKYIASNEDARRKMAYGSDNFIIAIVGSQVSYKGLWLEYALVLEALVPLFEGSPSDNYTGSHFKIIILSGDSAGNYTVAVEAIALNLNYPRGVVKQIAFDEHSNSVLSMADVVLYGSFREEQSFPEILIKAMCLGKPIIAPDLSMIKKYVDDRVNGFLFPKEDFRVLTKIITQVINDEKLSPLARTVGSVGKTTARNLMVTESVEGYAFLLEHILKLPSEVAPVKAVKDIPQKLKEEWQWSLFKPIADSAFTNKTLTNSKFLDKIEMQWNDTLSEGSDFAAPEETFVYSIWEEQKYIDIANARKRREEEELKDRTEQPRGTWEEVYRSAKKADRLKSILHERDDAELERTGQPLCIYEPFFGQGTWPFLHQSSLYRGIGLSTKGRRRGADDIDAPSRLPLLSNPYYRDALGEYGAFFAIANRIDRIHKNAWIGFQSWRATARKESLSKTAEDALLNAIQAHRHGDALYFWARMDMDPRNPSGQDFWSFCDAINAGNCKFAFSEALKKMYGLKHDFDSLPPMPPDGDSWSVTHSWVMPTRSFLEFVMFSRMFVDALDAQIYDEHHLSGQCYLSLSKDRHCYSRVLELLVNVWAYHSARRMVYVNPNTGLMQQQHPLRSRKGHMWIKWFSYATLKTMDEDLAEESDTDHPKRRWLWPSTGEVFWHGLYEKEKSLRNRQKEKKKQQSKDKISRMRKRVRQKTIGKYVKPLPEEEVAEDSTNSTVVAGQLFR